MSAQDRAPRTSLYRRLIAGAPSRKTRFHDELGEPVSLSRALRNGPRAFATGLLRLTLGRRPTRPWISYDAQAILAGFLTPASEVLEFGSGMSTLWYAGRAGHVVSIEDNAGWFEAVGPRLRAAGNVDYRFAGDRAAYVALAPDQAFDLIMIDGSWRDECAEFAIGRLKPGGIIYLDNSDKGIDPHASGDVPQARRTLLDFASRGGLPAHEITDFAPTQLFVQRGLLVGGPS